MSSIINLILIFLFSSLNYLLISSSFVRQSNYGLMKLCPPGGESFTAAWEITCGMRRKKRDEENQINIESSSNSLLKENNNLYEIKRLSLLSTSSTTALPADKYRAPSMTEMMLLCCKYGCSLRDLMPYCDPFGQWDS